ncbi:MAG: hypothetical protein AUH84_00090 [Thaumarchaeota archaeon 13_1_40CM_4_38_7]|nr:MAG: hypothetical protein AUH84_00090 [Thaumarchaeota archaeon 13_1_40CM_4_38_7]
MKLTFESILNECNRLAQEGQALEQATWLKSRLVKIRVDYENGVIDEKTYHKKELEILDELRKAGV